MNKKNVDSSKKSPKNLGKNNEAVEIPLQDEITLSGVLAVLSIPVTFVLMGVLCLLAAVFRWENNLMLAVMVLIFFAGITAFVIVLALGSRIDRKQALKVCTIPVRGRLVGYEQRQGYGKDRSRKIYAPKYEIFINNRYEIRTLDKFTIYKKSAEEMNLLAEPNGYKIISAAE